LPDVTTIALAFTDLPPHHSLTISNPARYENELW